MNSAYTYAAEFSADGVLGRTDVERRQRHAGVIRVHQCRRHVRRKHQRRLPHAVGIRHDAAVRDLERTRAGQVQLGHGWIERDERDIREPGVVAPGRGDLALNGQIAHPGVVERQQAAAVDRQIEDAVGAARGLAVFGMA